MIVIVSAIAFFALITGLILIHELGHFFAARAAGVEVEEFGFGLPPRAVTLFVWMGTSFTLNWIPFGGFVRLKGENALNNTERVKKGSFAHAPILARCGILVAGVAMNFILAFCIFIYGFSVGRWIPTYVTIDEMRAAADTGEISMTLGVVVDDVLIGGGAAEAGIEKGSIIIAIDGVLVDEPQDVVDAQSNKAVAAYTYRVGPAESAEERTVSVRVDEGKTGVYLRSTPLNVSSPMRGPLDAVRIAFRETRVVTWQTIIGMYSLFASLAQRGQVPEGVTGIVGIAQLTYVSVQEGFAVYLRLVALLSLSLAVLNILPFPALDGGRLVFVLSELFIAPGSRRVEILVNTIGFVVLLLVIVLVTLYDVFRLFA